MNKNVSILISVEAPDTVVYNTLNKIKDFVVSKGWEYECPHTGIKVLIDAKGLSLFTELPRTDKAIIKIKCSDCIFESASDKDSKMFELYVFDGRFTLEYPGRVNDNSSSKYYIGLDGNKDEVENFKKAVAGLIENWGGTEFEENIPYEVNRREKLVSDDCLRYRFNIPSGKTIPLSELANLTTGYPNVQFTFEMFYKEGLTAGFEIRNGEFASAYSACEEDWDNEEPDKVTIVEIETKEENKNETEVHPLEFFSFGVGICTIACLFALLIHLIGGV